MADARSINDVTQVSVDTVNNATSINAESENDRVSSSVASTEYWYEQSKYYAGQAASSAQAAAQSAQIAENARDTILTDAGFIAVRDDLANIDTVAGDITNINVIAEMIINNDNLLFYEEIE